MMDSKTSGIRLVLLLIVIGQCALAYDAASCCKQEFGEQAICGQTYSPGLPAAPQLTITYATCTTKCPSISPIFSDIRDLRQWAGPLVQFVLPAVIFSFSVPRRKKIEFDHLFDFPRITHWSSNARHLWLFSFLRLTVSLVFSTIILVPVIIDTMLWITVIVVGAGGMIVSGLCEAYLDYRIVQRVQGSNISPENRTELLLTLVSGNLTIDLISESPKIEIYDSLSTSTCPSERIEQRRVRLLAMLGSQYSFGAAIGAPVFFYLGAFIYTIVDLKSDPSNLDSAFTLAFGVEWMIVVHVAIVSGCLLASNNPSTSSAIVGHNPNPARHPHRAPTIPVMLPTKTGFKIKKTTIEEAKKRKGIVQTVAVPKVSFFKRAFLDPTGLLLGWSNAYPTKFQPVWMWDRGSNKMDWIRTTNGWTTDCTGFRKAMNFTAWGWFLKIYLPALVLVSLPPIAAAFVAYQTPPIGLGCRSLTFLVYGSCQLALAMLATVKNALNSKRDPSDGSSGMFNGWKYWAWSSPFLLGSFLAIIGGTSFQLGRVFHSSCACGIPLFYWTDLDSAPLINLATDTQSDRDSSQSWLLMGSVATGFMVFTCYVGWWYQRLIRKRFILVVEDIYRCGVVRNNSGAETDSMEPNDDHATEAPFLSAVADGPPLEELVTPESEPDEPIIIAPRSRTSILSNADATRNADNGDLSIAPLVEVELDNLGAE